MSTFGYRDLILRLSTSAMTARAAYRWNDRLTRWTAGAARRHLANAITEAASPILNDDARATEAGRRFVGEMACDDVDGVTARLWPEPRRLASTRVEGERELPVRGPAVILSFHLSGGFRVFDVLRARGVEPTFLCAPPGRARDGYERFLSAARFGHLSRTCRTPWIHTGPGVKDALGRHLGEGGVVVALLDVPPDELDLRDTSVASFLGRDVEMPVGILRLAHQYDAPIIPYDGRIEDGARTIRFHPSVRRETPEESLAASLATFETIIREAPWRWHGWLELDRYRPGPAPETRSRPHDAGGSDCDS